MGLGAAVAEVRVNGGRGGGVDPAIDAATGWAGAADTVGGGATEKVAVPAADAATTADSTDGAAIGADRDSESTRPLKTMASAPAPSPKVTAARIGQRAGAGATALTGAAAGASIGVDGEISAVVSGAADALTIV